MMALVTDEMVSTLAVRGTPEECAAELHRRFGDVADRVCGYFPGTTSPSTTLPPWWPPSPDGRAQGLVTGCRAAPDLF